MAHVARARQSARARGYDSRWERARLSYLAEHPLCVMCESQGIVEPATVVDHVKPHKGDPKLFWSRSNWQALCKPHHDRDKQREERRGYVAGVDAAGRPVDAQHPWNARR